MDYFKVIYFLFTAVAMALKQAQKYYSVPAPTSAPSTEIESPKTETLARKTPTWKNIQPRIVKDISTPYQPPHSSTPQPTSTGLSRYEGWKRAVVMHEIIQPYSHR